MKRENREQPRKWRARKRAGFNDKQAQKIGERLETVALRLGVPYVQLTTNQILEDAHVKCSPFNPLLEWDDVSAAISFRRTQVRHMMNHLDIEIIDDDGNPQRMKAFFNVRVNAVDEDTEDEEEPNVDCEDPEEEEDDEEEEGIRPHRAYVDMEALAANKSFRRDVAAECRKKLKYWATMVKQYGVEKEFQKILDAIDKYEAGKKKK